ncbi:DoxX family protein [Paenibacillus hexagrammi]|uniref:DoxX family protein n=1 Tax=Paenibacillus hexagrammi TaxID=2908839 RepID=A0ABY3SM72_9BACL|nr:DoxX family protein [Paenibacillus sp. YPD9-1]UJF34952.1 DoxX family protein [Paenibacillus sp. YPD9-1]
MPANKQKIKTIAYWVTTILGPASFVMGGYLFTTHGAQQVETLQHLGYPVYVLTMLGICKLLGVIAILVPRFPRLKEWAYAGFFFDLAGAAASHAFSGESLFVIIQPLVFLVLVMASWALRPASRKLASK